MRVGAARCMDGRFRGIFVVVLHPSSFWSFNCVNSQFDRSKGSVAKEGRN